MRLWWRSAEPVPDDDLLGALAGLLAASRSGALLHVGAESDRTGKSLRDCLGTIDHQIGYDTLEAVDVINELKRSAGDERLEEVLRLAVAAARRALGVKREAQSYDEARRAAKAEQEAKKLLTKYEEDFAEIVRRWCRQWSAKGMLIRWWNDGDEQTMHVLRRPDEFFPYLGGASLDALTGEISARIAERSSKTWSQAGVRCALLHTQDKLIADAGGMSIDEFRAMRHYLVAQWEAVDGGLRKMLPELNGPDCECTGCLERRGTPRQQIQVE